MILSKKANNKDTDQTARMRRLLCACVVRKPPEDRFSRVEAQLVYVISGMKRNEKIKKIEKKERKKKVGF